MASSVTTSVPTLRSGSAAVEAPPRRAPVLASGAAVRWRANHVVYGSRGPRRYLAPGLTVEAFFMQLNRWGTPYVALRWFETLPVVARGEDVDLLVADEALEKVHELLLDRPWRPGSQAFDVYSVSGLPGSDHGDGIPYFPPAFARTMLQTSVLQRGLARVPDPERHLLSLAYHAAYHKGHTSGLPANAQLAPVQARADHDYASSLTRLADQVGATLEPTLEDLDRFLAQEGLRPPLDTLERLARSNSWIGEHFLAPLTPTDEVWDGLAVFVIRERAMPERDRIVAELGVHGFEILAVEEPEAPILDAAHQGIRGGNWERGPWHSSGGGPAAFVIAYDVAPWISSTDLLLNNGRIPEAKGKVRNTLLADLPQEQRYNPLHSSDNPRQALEYLALMGDPDLVERVRQAALELRETCTPPFPVREHLGSEGPSRRARVFLVDHPVHGPSVCKVFRPSARDYLEREVRARRELHDVPLIPRLLERGENWFLTPYYHDDRGHVLRSLPVPAGGEDASQLTWSALRAVCSMARELHRRGFFILDLATKNLYSDPQEGLKVLDLEFLQEYPAGASIADGGWTFRGVPARQTGYDVPQDVPMTGPGVANPVFHPAIAGLPIPMLENLHAYHRPRRTMMLWVWYARFAVTLRLDAARSWLRRHRHLTLPLRVVRRLARLARARRRPAA